MKKMKYICLFLCVLCLTACGNEETRVVPQQEELGENQLYAYYVNMDKTDLVTRVCTYDVDKNVVSNASAIIQVLVDVKQNEDYQSPIPEGITYDSTTYNEKKGRVEVSFDIFYDMVDADTLLFFKASVVKTLLQLQNVDSVTISLTDLSSSNAETATVSENFDQDSFTMSFGNASGYNQRGTIVLYFANESGEELKEYRKTIEISNNSSLARIVVESIIDGPEGDAYKATVSPKTTIQNISVKDGICYVDLSEEFYDTDNSLRNDIIVYSIVNSLAELPTVSKVQFLKNGEKQQFFRETMPFDGIFERNLDLIEQEDTEY